MTSPERNLNGRLEKAGFLERLKKALGQILHGKREEELAKKAVEAQLERERQESLQKRQAENAKIEQDDKRRKYHDVRSMRLKEERADVVREIRAQEVVSKLNVVLRNVDNRPDGSNYLLEEINQDANLQQAVVRLISESPSAAEVVDSMISQGFQLHGNSRALMKLAQRLNYEADRVGGDLYDAISPLLDVIKGRAEELLAYEYKRARIEARAQKEEIPTMMDFLLGEPGIVMSDEEKMALSAPIVSDDGKIDWEGTYDTWTQKAGELVKERRAVDEQKARWVRERETSGEELVLDKIVAPIDDIWSEVARREATGGQMSAEELETVMREIQEVEASVYPRDVPPGSEEWTRKVQGLHRHTEEKLDSLGRMFAKRTREQRSSFKQGIVDPKVFLEQVVLNKGRLGGLISKSPQMHKLLLGTNEESRKFRDKVFLKIHSAVLSNQRNSSSDNFGLYERADFTTFIDLLRIGLGKDVVSETGQPLGQAWSDYYNNLSNAIRQSRDLDFWAYQPGATMEYFNKSLGMFQNEYIAAALSMPAVNAAFRAYEMTLRSIMSSCDGYIPPGLIEYSAVRKGSYWDLWSKDALQHMIEMGAVKRIKRNQRTGFGDVESDGHTLKLSQEALKLSESSEDEDEKLMYMTLAKGLGLVSARFIEMFANSKVPGSDQPERGIDQFHSMPYEGVGKAMNYVGTYIHKWKMGSYKYFYLVNQLIPDKRKWVSNSREAIEAFMAYQDGTFAEKYGEDAKRFLDVTNFTGISSAIGKETLWRQWDSTLGWPDKKREVLGGPTQLALSERYAKEAVKRYLVVNKYREEYRRSLIRKNQAGSGELLAISGAGFDKLWKEYGVYKYKARIEREWEELEGRHPKKGRRHTALAEKTRRTVENYQNAFKARVFVEMAMRNPLVIAHNLKVDVPLVGVEGTKKTRLHNLLVQDILGIPPEDTKFIAEYGKTAYGTTPSKQQMQYMSEIMLLERDISAVREKAIETGEDLTEECFRNIIKDEARLNNALEYWRKVRLVILGTDKIKTRVGEKSEAEKLYEKFGLRLLDNGEDYAWDNQKIQKIGETLDGLEEQYGNRVTTVKNQEGKDVPIPFLLKEAVDTEIEWIWGTDDIAFRLMDLENLGARHWLRRGGDIAAHEAGGDAFVDYLRHGLKPNPDKKELAEMLNKIVDAYSGDMIEIGWTVAGNLAYMTDRFYAFDAKKLGSSAQVDVWRTRRNVAGWTANGRREFWDNLEYEDVLPPDADFYHYNWIEKMQNIHNLRDMCHANNSDVIIEMLLLGTLLAAILTMWRAFTAKSEEEDGEG